MFVEAEAGLYDSMHLVPLRIFGYHLAVLTNDGLLARTLSRHFAAFRERVPGPHALRIYLLDAEGRGRRYPLTLLDSSHESATRTKSVWDWRSLLEEIDLQREVEACWTGREYYFTGRLASVPRRAINAVILALVGAMSRDGYVPLRASAVIGPTGAVAIVSESLDVEARALSLLLRRGCRLATNYWLFVRPAAQGIQMAGVMANAWSAGASTGASLFSVLLSRLGRRPVRASPHLDGGRSLLGIGSIGPLKEIQVLRERPGAVGWHTKMLDQVESLQILKDAASPFGELLAAVTDPDDLDACLGLVSSSIPVYEVGGQIPMDWLTRTVIRSLSDAGEDLRKEAYVA